MGRGFTHETAKGPAKAVLFGETVIESLFPSLLATLSVCHKLDEKGFTSRSHC
jgi:hypothetical protein